MSEYGAQAFRWTEKTYKLQDILEQHDKHLPFIVFVTDGYCGNRDEITADEIYWVHEIVIKPCIVVRNTNDRYFSIPVCFETPVIPLKISAPGKYSEFVDAAQPMSVAAFRHFGESNYFRFADTGSQEVFDGACEGEEMYLGPLEFVDMYEEKMLAAHPLLPSSKPNDLLMQELHRTRRPFKGAVYPLVTLIPVWFPINVSIAMCWSKRSDHKFFKAMLELKKLADTCDHNYDKFMTANAEIMLFNRPPVDKIYDYIELMPLLQKRKNEPSSDYDPCGFEGEDTDSDVSYDSIDPIKLARLSVLKHRIEPVILDVDMPPEARLQQLREAYDTGLIPEEDEPDEEPDLPAEAIEDTPKPPVPPRRRQSAAANPGSTVPPLPTRSPIHPTVECGVKYKSSTVVRSASGLASQRAPPPVPTDKTKILSLAPTKSKSYENCGFEQDYEEVNCISSSSPRKDPDRKQPSSPDSASRVRASNVISELRNHLSSINVNKDAKERGHAVTPGSPDSHSGDVSGATRGTPVHRARSIDDRTTTGITCMADIPADIEELNVSQLMDCLRLLNMSEQIPALDRNLVDGDLLKCLNETLLREHFGFSPFDAKKLVRFANGWRPKIT